MDDRRRGPWRPGLAVMDYVGIADEVLRLDCGAGAPIVGVHAWTAKGMFRNVMAFVPLPGPGRVETDSVLRRCGETFADIEAVLADYPDHESMRIVVVIVVGLEQRFEATFPRGWDADPCHVANLLVSDWSANEDPEDGCPMVNVNRVAESTRSMLEMLPHKGSLGDILGSVGRLDRSGGLVLPLTEMFVFPPLIGGWNGSGRLGVAISQHFTGGACSQNRMKADLRSLSIGEMVEGRRFGWYTRVTRVLWMFLRKVGVVSRS